MRQRDESDPASAAQGEIVARAPPSHLPGWSCLVTGEEGPGICPGCLYEAFQRDAWTND